MNGYFSPLTGEVWIKIDRMIVNLKSLKRGQMKGIGIKIGIVENARDSGKKYGKSNLNLI